MMEDVPLSVPLPPLRPYNFNAFGVGCVGDGGRGNNGKKMRKRRELDALVSSVGAVSNHTSLARHLTGTGLKHRVGIGMAYNSASAACAGVIGRTNGVPLCVRPGTNYHDHLLSESSDESQELQERQYWRGAAVGSGHAHAIGNYKRSSNRNRGDGVLKNCQRTFTLVTVFFIMSCLIVTTVTLWLFLDLKHQTSFLQDEMKKVSTGSQGIPQSLEKCQEQTKELQRNQTDIIIKFLHLNDSVGNFSLQMLVLANNITNIYQSLNDSARSFQLLINNFNSTLNESLKKFQEQILELKENGINSFNKTLTGIQNKYEVELITIQNINKNVTERIAALEDQFKSTKNKKQAI